MRTALEPREPGAPIWSPTEELMEIMDVDAGMMAELLSLFVADATTRLQILRGACARLDVNVIRAQAHSVKGSALQLGAPGLAYCCAELELSDSPQPDRCESMMQSIDDEFALVSRAMEAYLTGAGTGQGTPSIEVVPR